jgi:hypothetical protein
MTRDEPTHERLWGDGGWFGDLLTRGTVARLGCATLLFAAAVLKVYQLATDPALGVLYGFRWLQVGLVQYEYVLAVWMLSGLFGIYCRNVALLTFTGFACVAAYLGLTDAESCGCFGQVHVNPWFMLGIDVVAVLSISRWLPRVSQGATWNSAFPGPIVGAVFVAGLAAPAIAAIAPYQFTATGGATDEEIVLLEPEKWIGGRFPLFHEIDIGPRLARGSWVIVLFQHTCSHCQAILPRYEQLAKLHADGPGAFRIALIEVPPHDPNEPSPSALCELGRLNGEKEWFVATPAEILLRDGQVVDARTSDDVDIGLEEHAADAFAVSHNSR